MRLSILWRIIEIEEVVIRAFSQSELGKYFEWIIISVNTALSGVNFKIIFLARKPRRNTRISGTSFFRFTLTFSLFAAKTERQNTRCGQWWRELSKTVRGTNKVFKKPSITIRFLEVCPSVLSFSSWSVIFMFQPIWWAKIPTVRIFLPFSYFDCYRLKLKGEPLNCPVDRNILIRDKVGDHTTTNYGITS